MSPFYRFEFRPYRRKFKYPLRTFHGTWMVREGIVIRSIDPDCNIGWGEIAPLPQFGSETFDRALQFCQQLPQEIDRGIVGSIPQDLPACQFAFASAIDATSVAYLKPDCMEFKHHYSYLLPTGEEVLFHLESIPDLPEITAWKWKIGVAPIERELNIFHHLILFLPPSIRLRLDANGGLSDSEAERWLSVCDRLDERVEFLEQPLPPEEFPKLLELSQKYRTPIALDESVGNLQKLQACYERGWRGIFTIKPSIAGFPERLLAFCRDRALDVVFSSVFETEVGKTSVLRLAEKLQLQRALGFGVDRWFEPEINWLEKLWEAP